MSGNNPFLDYLGILPTEVRSSFGERYLPIDSATSFLIAQNQAHLVQLCESRAANGVGYAYPTPLLIDALDWVIDDKPRYKVLLDHIMKRDDDYRVALLKSDRMQSLDNWFRVFPLIVFNEVQYQKALSELDRLAMFGDAYAIMGLYKYVKGNPTRSAQMLDLIVRKHSFGASRLADQIHWGSFVARVRDFSHFASFWLDDWGQTYLLRYAIMSIDKAQIEVDVPFQASRKRREYVTKVLVTEDPYQIDALKMILALQDAPRKFVFVVTRENLAEPLHRGLRLIHATGRELHLVAGSRKTPMHVQPLIEGFKFNYAELYTLDDVAGDAELHDIAIRGFMSVREDGSEYDWEQDKVIKYH